MRSALAVERSARRAAAADHAEVEARPAGAGSLRCSARRRALAAGLGAMSLLLVPDAEADVPIVGERHGGPRIEIDRLTFPPGIPKAKEHARELERTLKREARRADWGTGRSSTITFRFEVDALRYVYKEDVLEVRCRAHGELPGHRLARGHLAFSGDPRRHHELTRRVLEIVARGVIARLAELERERRAE